MSYTATYRGVTSFASGLLLCIAAAFYLVPEVSAGKSPLMILLLKLGCGGIVLVAVFMLMHAFRECAVITDDGLIKLDLFGRETRLGWKDISRFQIKPDDNKVIFRDSARAKLTMSLAYDGWQDFSDMAFRRLTPALYWQFKRAVANIDAKRTNLPSTRKTRWAKWFPFRGQR